MASEVLFQVKDGIGTITLNKPSTLNSLTLGMVREISAILEKACREGSGVDCIVVKGAGGKAFCAGGDVKAVVAAAKAGDLVTPNAFFQEEYQMNLAISRCPIPYVCLLDGIVMGGGVGLSVHGHFRVATERTVFAMPECAIGLFTDVGATYFLGRLPGAMGPYLATTGARLSGVTVREFGLATHYVTHAEMQQLEAALHALGRRGEARDLSKVAGLLDRLQGAHGPLPLGLRWELQPLVDVHFSHPTMEGIMSSLQAAAASAPARASADPVVGFAKEALMQLAKGSPLSQKVCLAAIRRAAAAHLPLATCLQAEGVLASRFITDASDFREGVTALLVEKGRPAKWRYPSLEQVPPSAVEWFFEGTALAATAATAAGGACGACSGGSSGQARPQGCSCPAQSSSSSGAVAGGPEGCCCGDPRKCRCAGCNAAAGAASTEIVNSKL